MVRSTSGSLKYWKAVDDITNQLNPQPPHVIVEKSQIVENTIPQGVVPVAASKRKPPVKGRGKKRGRYKTQVTPEEPVPRSCKFCETNFPEEYLCLEHEDVCRKVAPPGEDIRDDPNPNRLSAFAASLGLAPIATISQEVSHPQSKPAQPVHNVVDHVTDSVESKQSDEFVFKRPMAPPVRFVRRSTIPPVPVRSVRHSTTPPVPVPGRSVRQSTTETTPPVPVRNLRKVVARSKIRAFIKKHPILPITSGRGQKILEEFGERIKPSTVFSTPSYEKDCCSKIVAVPPCDPPISTLKRHKFQDGQGQYLHHYSFSNRQRKERNVELILGMSTKSFQLYNSCKPGVLKLDKLGQDVVEKIEARDTERRRKFVKHIQAIEKDPFPVVRVRDVLKDPDALTEAERKTLKINFKIRPKGFAAIDMLDNRKPEICLRDLMKDPGAIPENERKNLKINLNLPGP